MAGGQSRPYAGRTDLMGILVTRIGLRHSDLNFCGSAGRCSNNKLTALVLPYKGRRLACWLSCFDATFVSNSN